MRTVMRMRTVLMRVLFQGSSSWRAESQLVEGRGARPSQQGPPISQSSAECSACRRGRRGLLSKDTQFLQMLTILTELVVGVPEANQFPQRNVVRCPFFPFASSPFVPRTPSRAPTRPRWGPKGSSTTCRVETPNSHASQRPDLDWAVNSYRC